MNRKRRPRKVNRSRWCGSFEALEPRLACTNDLYWIAQSGGDYDLHFNWDPIPVDYPHGGNTGNSVWFDDRGSGPVLFPAAENEAYELLVDLANYDFNLMGHEFTFGNGTVGFFGDATLVLRDTENLGNAVFRSGVGDEMELVPFEIGDSGYFGRLTLLDKVRWEARSGIWIGGTEGTGGTSDGGLLAEAGTGIYTFGA